MKINGSIDELRIKTIENIKIFKSLLCSFSGKKVNYKSIKIYHSLCNFKNNKFKNFVYVSIKVNS